MASISVNFVKLATFTEIESFIYGGQYAVTHFVRAVRKSNWFAFSAVSLKLTGSVDFGGDFSANVNRSGDYVLNAWLRVRLPQLTIAGAGTAAWCHNPMHNLVETCKIKFNELTVHEFDSQWFDFKKQFDMKPEKRVAYDNMIGDVATMTTPILGTLGDGGWRNLPLPLFFTYDSGIALPVAALPFNDITIDIKFRALVDILVFTAGTTIANVTATATGLTPALVPATVQVWAHYAVVHNDERVRMGKCPRDMVITQTQSVSEAAFTATAGTRNSYDMRLSHAITALYFGIRNITVTGDRSNYTTVSPFSTGGGSDPVGNVNLTYENTHELFEMGSDYTGLVAPWYFANSVTDVDNYMHMISYALRAFDVDPCGSVNYSKLTNVSLGVVASDAGVTAEATETFRMNIRAMNHNIIRVYGGSLGLPVL